MAEVRLIDANALKPEMEILNAADMHLVCHIIDNVPTIEAEPVRHGRWIVRGQDIYCSECNEEGLYNPFGASKFSHFCPNCGVLMDGGALLPETPEKE